MTESWLTVAIRILAGLLLVVSGANKFLAFMPNPPHNEAAAAYLGALAASGYVFPLIGFLEIACGAAFIAGRYVALAAIVLAPIAINIVLFHAMLEPAGGVPGFFVGAATLYLLVASFPKYRELLEPR